MRKLILGGVVCVAAVAAILLSIQEQQIRLASEAAHEKLEEVIASGGTLTDAEVHQRLGRDPDEVRRPAKHRLVEEYHWSGNFRTYTVYAYYSTAAAKLLTAVSINQAMPDWEQADE